MLQSTCFRCLFIRSEHFKRFSRYMLLGMYLPPSAFVSQFWYVHTSFLYPQPAFWALQASKFSITSNMPEFRVKVFHSPFHALGSVSWTLPLLKSLQIIFINIKAKSLFQYSDCMCFSGASCYLSLLPGSLNILQKGHAFYVSSMTAAGKSMAQNIPFLHSSPA